MLQQMNCLLIIKRILHDKSYVSLERETIRNHLAIVLSIGAIQGITYGFILWKHKSLNKKANKFLAVILWFFAYRLLVEGLKLFGIGYYDTWYHFLL